jgi:hypothetical protein
MSFKLCEVVSAQKLIRAGEGDGSWEGRSSLRSNIPNLIYSIKPSYFSIIFEALNSTDSGLQLCLSKYVR